MSNASEVEAPMSEERLGNVERALLTVLNGGVVFGSPGELVAEVRRQAKQIRDLHTALNVYEGMAKTAKPDGVPQYLALARAVRVLSDYVDHTPVDMSVMAEVRDDLNAILCADEASHV